MNEHEFELKFLQAMTKPDRQYFLEELALKEEEYTLSLMVYRNKKDTALADGFMRMASMWVNDDINKAEDYAQLARGVSRARHTIADFRKQRERIQWQRKKLSKMTKPPTE